jgi:sugar O-acyltransferase (sialic acid O-acetyltransferase NeuD family)
VKKILVYGSQEFGQVVKDFVCQCGHEFIGFIDDYNIGQRILGNFTQVAKKFPYDAYDIAIAIGYKHLQARWNIFQRVRSLGYRFPHLIHPRAYVRDVEAIGEGTMVMANAVVDVRASIGPLVVIWPGVVVNHNSVIAANTFLSPNATVCGYVSVGESCFVGAGATIVDHTDVPPNSFIKAGAVYFKKTENVRHS